MRKRAELELAGEGSSEVFRIGFLVMQHSCEAEGAAENKEEETNNSRKWGTIYRNMSGV